MGDICPYLGSLPNLDLLSGEEEDGGDLISRLVSRNTLLSTPTVSRSSRKVSLQEELTGGNLQVTNSIESFLRCSLGSSFFNSS